MRVPNTLEKRRPLLLLSGLTIALSFTLAAFEWQTPYHKPIPFEVSECLDCEIEDTPIVVKKKKATKVKVDLTSKPKIDTKPVEVPIDPTELKEDLEVTEDPEGYDELDEGDVEDGNYEIDTESVRKPWELDSQPQYVHGNENLRPDLIRLARPPQYCYELDAGAVVSVRFVVDKEGNITNPTIAKSTSRCFEQAAIEALLKLDGFKPGMRAGHPVPVEMHQTFRFELKE